MRSDALDALDRAITESRADPRPSKLVRQADGSIVEEPVRATLPRDLAIFPDRLAVPSAKPSSICQHQGLTVSSEISADVLRQFIEATLWAGPTGLA